MREESRKDTVERYVEEYGKKMRLMALGLSKMFEDNSRALHNDELAEYVRLLGTEASWYSTYREELDKLEEEEDAQ